MQNSVNNNNNDDDMNTAHDTRYDYDEVDGRALNIDENGCCSCSRKEKCCAGGKVVPKENDEEPDSDTCINNDGERMRGGCGRGSYVCDCGGNSQSGNNSGSTRHEACPSYDMNTCCRVEIPPCSTVTCPPPCVRIQGCCPPPGCRPVCRKEPRCYLPCTARAPSCGSGGCCGGGCRGGCGKEGRPCMPSRSCSTPPCPSLRYQPCNSPCSPSRSCPLCCKVCNVAGTPCCASGGSGGGGKCCRSKSPGSRLAGGCCSTQDNGMIGGCQAKFPSRCECLGGGLDCQRCGRKVYQAEMQTASGVPYHNICFSCFCCRKPLEPLTYQENCGEIYCKQCYVRNFGPQGYGYGVGAGVLQTPM